MRYNKNILSLTLNHQTGKIITMQIANSKIKELYTNSSKTKSATSFGNTYSIKGPQIDEFKKKIAESNIRNNVIKANRKRRTKNVMFGLFGGIGAVTTVLVGLFGGGAPKTDQKNPVIDFPPAIIENQPEREEDFSFDFQVDFYENAKHVLEINEQVNVNFEQLKSAVDRFSEQLGEDAYSLILDRVDELGNNRVDPIDVVKILWIESKGRIYSKDDPTKIIESSTGQAFGPFQITPGAAEFVNSYYGLEGTENELDYMDPYDNIDISILYLRYMQYERGKDIQEGVPLPTGDDVDLAVAWGYHDGAWAEKVTRQGQKYLKEYQNLSYIDEYPEVIDYFFSQDPLS